MHDIYDIITNVKGIYESNTSFQVLKDFERVLAELDLYVYKNWEDGELCEGPNIERHWVTCSFLWPREQMPDPMGGKRLLDYDCKVGFKKDYVLKPRKIRSPDDIRPGTKKGKLDRHPIWVVTIQMPKTLISDIYSGYNEMLDAYQDPAAPDQGAVGEAQPGEEAAAAPAPDAAAPAPAAPETI